MRANLMGVLAAMAMLWEPSSAAAQTGDSDPLVVLAWSGVASDDVGELYDANFRPLRRSVLADDATPRATPDARTFRSVVRSAGQLEVQASARAWGVEGGAALSTSFGYVRAIQVERVYELPRHADTSTAPAEAAYVVSRVTYGRLYEMRVQGTAAAVSARVEAIAGAGALSAAAQSATVEGLTLGLVPRGDALTALAASTPEELIARFEVRGDPVPILVEFEAISRRGGAIATVPAPDSAASAPATVRLQVAVIALAFPERKPGNGWPWDVGSGPDMAVEFRLGGTRIAEVDASMDTTSQRFTSPQGLPSVVELAAGARLELRFFDRDALANDECGVGYLDASATSGDVTVRSPEGASAILRVQRLP